ncbi:MAG: Na/Pi cotransporter family protein [Clostridiales bacterium]|nr:Na/Pi cotransporter family protein [Clostridiales bacterium]
MTIFDLFTLLGGLGLFLYGMDMMGKGLESAAGNRLKTILEKLTSNRLMGVLVGTLVTCVIQSSSATTVMVVGFVNAGLMNLSQAFGVILGANIGTTITAQIIAFDLSQWAPLFIIIGVVPLLFSKKQSIQSYFTIVAGFGILFFGMNTMSTSMEPLRDSQWFLSFISSFENPIMGVLVGVIFTAIIQSSSASIGILQALAASGVIGVSAGHSAGLYLVLGANIGTCITAVLASTNGNTMAKRAAVIHVMANIIGTIWFGLLIAFVPIPEVVASWSPNDPARIIANFHTIFNVANTILLLPFGGLVIKFINKIIKQNKNSDEDDNRLLYLDDRIVDTPTMASISIHQELGHLADKTYRNLERALESFSKQSEDMAEKVFSEEKSINYIASEIVRFLVKLQAMTEISDTERLEIFRVHEVVSNIERIGDHAENIAEYTLDCKMNDSKFSKDALDDLWDIAEHAKQAYSAAIKVIKGEGHEEEERRLCWENEDMVDKLRDEMKEKHIRRLAKGECDPRSGMIYADMVVDLERIADHATNLVGDISGEPKMIAN